MCVMLRFALHHFSCVGTDEHRAGDRITSTWARKREKRLGVEYNVITCTMRHHSAKQNYQMIKTACQFLGRGVCAADLAGAEAQYPMTEFMELFEQTKKLGMLLLFMPENVEMPRIL